MNKEYNDNREYKNAMDELHFSEEAKNRMVDRLMERAEQPASRRVRRFPRVAAVGIAAALVLSIGAGASGVLKSASEVFAGVFGPTADTEIIDQIGRPIGASDTSNGVTVTADAILFDGYNYLISYTLEKDDGSAFDCTKNPDTGLYDLYWKRSDSTIGRGVDGASGSSYFYDENPSDNAIQYVETMSYNDAVQTGGTVKITLGDLCVPNSETSEETTIAKGAWRLKFKLEADNSAVELPAGQNIDVNGRSATVDTIVLSPIGYHVVSRAAPAVQGRGGYPRRFLRNRRGIQGGPVPPGKIKGSQKHPLLTPLYISYSFRQRIYSTIEENHSVRPETTFSSECSLCATVTASGRVSSTYSICELSILTMPRSFTACCSTSVMSMLFIFLVVSETFSACISLRLSLCLLTSAVSCVSCIWQ